MNVLHSAFGLDHLAPEHHIRIEQSARWVRMPAGTTVYGNEESGSDVYFVEAGEVSLRRRTVYGDFVLQRIAAPGLFGELSLIDHGRRAADAVASKDAEILAVDAERLKRQMRADQSFAVALHWGLWRNLAHRLREINLRMARFTASDDAKPFHEPPRRPPALLELPLDERRALLRELGLSNMEVNYLATLSTVLALEPDQVLFSQGEHAGFVYVVSSGRVMISTVIPGAGLEALAFLGRGQLFGEMAAIEQLPRSARASAAEDGAVVLAIPREVLDKLLDLKRASSIRLLQLACRQLAERLRESQEKLVGWFILAGGHGQSGPLSEP
jgi:CRP-like cAMP-binding protein